MQSKILKSVILLSMLGGLAGAADAYVIATKFSSAVGEVDGTGSISSTPPNPPPATITITIAASDIPATGLNLVSSISLTLDLVKCNGIGPLVVGGTLMDCANGDPGFPGEISVTLTGPNGAILDLIIDDTNFSPTYTDPNQSGRITLTFDDLGATVGPDFISGTFSPAGGSFEGSFGNGQSTATGDWILTIADNSQDDPLGFENFSLTITGVDAAIPAPGTTALLALGLLALPALRRRTLRVRC